MSVDNTKPLTGIEQKTDGIYAHPVVTEPTRADCIFCHRPLVPGLIISTCPDCFRGYVGGHHAKWHPLSFPPENRGPDSADAMRKETKVQVLAVVKTFRETHAAKEFVLGAGSRIYYHEKCLGL